MVINPLDDNEKSRVRSSWGRVGASSAFLATLDRDFAGNTVWCEVCGKDGATEAVFEIRKAPNYYKNMTIIFSPLFDIDFENTDYEEVKPKIDRFVNILADIFGHLLRGLTTRDNNHFKIYNDNENVRLIFYEFCRYLKDEYPNNYKTKFYGKWLEIHTTA